MSERTAKGVKNWRNKTKEIIVEVMGGCCQICQYSKCNSALELHHIDPSKKELSFGRIRANPVSIDKIAEELKKCILLCSNCHKEIHYNIVVLPEDYIKFDPEFFKKIDKERKIRKNIGIEKLKGPNRSKISCSNEELYMMLMNDEYRGNKSKLAKYFNVSDSSIHKRIKKINYVV